MAQWRANPQMYGPGGGEFVDDNGQIWPDPWGTLNTQAQAPVPGVNAGAPDPNALGGGGELGAPPPGLQDFVAAQNPPQPPPAAHQTPTAAPGIGTPEGLTAAMDAPMPDPAASRGLADRGAAPGSGAPDPAASRGLADQSQTTSSVAETSGSTGLSKDAQARQGANITQVADQQTKAVDAGVAVGNLQATQARDRSAMLLKDASANIEKVAAEQAVNDHIQNEVNRKMQAGADWRPDRAELFHGDNGVAFGLSAAVAAMAGAWMQGRGLTGNNPYLPTIMKMIDDNVSDQVRKNSTSMQYLREQKGDLKAAALELKQKQLHYVQQRLDGLALKDQSEIFTAGTEKTRQELLAQNAKWEQEKRQSLERTTSSNVTKTLTQAPRAGANSTAAMQAGGQLRQLDRIIGDLEQAEKAGDLENVTGWQSKLGANGFQEFFGGLPPGQQKALNALRELELINRSDWKSEPNGQAIQERLSQIGIAKNDRDIPVMMERLKSMRADRALGLAGARVAEPDPTNGAF